MVPERFRIAIPESRLQDMRQRLTSAAWPGDFGNEQWHYGVEQTWLRDMVDYWIHDYDWRAAESKMNAFAQYRVEIGGVPIHFIHIKSGRPGAIPLILTHGWPWTFWDWREVITELCADQSQPAFDIVVPSLPGVAFSSPLRTAGLNVREIARLWVRLMCEVLGYPRFAAAGGDWGSLITAELGHAHPDRIIAIHLTMVLLHGLNQYTLAKSDYAADEQWMYERIWAGLPSVGSHVAVQGSDPQTLAYALADSPVGTAAWIWERRRAWSDCDADIAQYQGRDFLCTLASIYWLTNTIGSSLRIYKEQFSGTGLSMDWPLLHDRQPQIPVPTGVAVAPKELGLLPRSLVAARTNLQRWQVLERGGHFLPAEQPKLLAAEYRAYFGAVGL